jgi:hypothetical protein
MAKATPPAQEVLDSVREECEDVIAYWADGGNGYTDATFGQGKVAMAKDILEILDGG